MSSAVAELRSNPSRTRRRNRGAREFDLVKLGSLDSNQDWNIQSVQCCHYTTPQCARLRSFKGK